MLIFKTRYFSRWAKKMNVSDSRLAKAIAEMEAGLIEVELSKNLYKKRIALQTRGKRGGGRTIIIYKKQEKVFFIYGFAKNEKENISTIETEAFKRYGDILLNMDQKQLNDAIIDHEIMEVKNEQ